MSRGVVLIAAIALAGCGGAGEVSLRTDRSGYLVDETAAVTVENVDAHSFGFAMDCTLVLEGSASDNLWTVIRRSPVTHPDLPAEGLCYALGDGLVAGETRTFHWPFDPGLVAGTYRFALSTEVRRAWRSAPERIVLHSEPFFVFAE